MSFPISVQVTVFFPIFEQFHFLVILQVRLLVAAKFNHVFIPLFCLVAEDLDDLRMEGVTSVVSSGSKFNQTRSAHTAEPQAKVTLNICARCAR